jgi:hypothetical protein
MTTKAMLFLLALLLSACASKRSELPPPPEQPTILIDDPKTCCDPCIKPKVTSEDSEPECTGPQPNNSFKPNPLRGSA